MRTVLLRCGWDNVEINLDEGENISAAVPLMQDHCERKRTSPLFVRRPWFHYELVEPVNAKARDDWHNVRVPFLNVNRPPPKPVEPIKFVEPEYVPPPHIEMRPVEPRPIVVSPEYSTIAPYSRNFGHGFGEEPFIPHNWGNDDGDLFDHLDSETRNLIREAIVIDDLTIEAQTYDRWDRLMASKAAA
ncbi:MAG: hypothetical protein H0T60_18625 [Acidobacteria bacterium]|nr:hypothetical protein [Acidobacteriota bacterium]